MFSHKVRADRLRKVLELIKADACIVKSEESRRYLTGITTSQGMVVITRAGNRYFLTDTSYEEMATRSLSPQGFTVRTVGRQAEYAMFINEIIQADKIKVALLESNGISHEEYLALENALYARVLPLKTQLDKLRMVKDLAEVENIKTAQRINEKSFEDLLGYIKPGMTEKQVQAKLVQLMLENGSDLEKFHICCVSGANSSLVHGSATDKRIEKGDNLMLEFGAVYNGYRSDMARTISIGQPSDEFRKAYQIVQNACVIGQRYIRKGVSGRAADREIRRYIEDNGYRNYFRHSLGHGIGIQLHEGPYLARDSTDVLTVGNVVTMEPGIYIKGRFGIRIEDLLYISSMGTENLTRTTRDLIIL
ncbi:MAG: aminopeptidase P family protein [Oscillospiraceae bacterium]|nr:aminopeptidase P family protein [Oscillospiraceae bacterium]